MAEFTGERVIPDQVDRDLWNEHVSRYSFAARLCRGRRVLEVGCGAGYGTAELARSAHRVLGLDVSAEAIRMARESYGVPNARFLVGSCEALPFADCRFDTVVAFEVIEHVSGWRDLLAEARRVLAPGGQLIVSTPNKRYYAETRADTGPNPYHVHEFELAEFQSALREFFPYVSLYVQNHADGIVFRPVEHEKGTEMRVEESAVEPEEAHFFLGVCALAPQTGAPTFVYLPKAGNVLRERELHIAKLESELRLKDDWIAEAQREHARLSAEQQKLVHMFRALNQELEQRTHWAHKLEAQVKELEGELEQAGERIAALQRELESEQAAARETVAGYEHKIAELEGENQAKTEWALRTEQRLGDEVRAARRELGECSALLEAKERELAGRTEWALSLQREKAELEARLGMYRSSRWVKLGKAIGLGPEARRAE